MVKKQDFCLCENKCADQLRSNCEADQRLCFCYTDCSTMPLLLKYKISSFLSSPVTVQLGLCQTLSETRRLFFRCGSFSREVNSSGVAFPSPCMMTVAPKLLRFVL